jgi:hypothetical protein
VPTPPLFVPWPPYSMACVISFFPVCGWLLFLVAVGVLLDIFGIALFLLG